MTWTVAEGRRGRRWREVVARGTRRRPRAAARDRSERAVQPPRAGTRRRALDLPPRGRRHAPRQPRRIATSRRGVRHVAGLAVRAGRRAASSRARRSAAAAIAWRAREPRSRRVGAPVGRRRASVRDGTLDASRPRSASSACRRRAGGSARGAPDRVIDDGRALPVLDGGERPAAGARHDAAVVDSAVDKVRQTAAKFAAKLVDKSVSAGEARRLSLALLEGAPDRKQCRGCKSAVLTTDRRFLRAFLLCPARPREPARDDRDPRARTRGDPRRPRPDRPASSRDSPAVRPRGPVARGSACRSSSRSRPSTRSARSRAAARGSAVARAGGGGEDRPRPAGRRAPRPATSGRASPTRPARSASRPSCSPRATRTAARSSGCARSARRSSRSGEDFDAARAASEAYAAEHPVELLVDGDDPRISTGAATLALELTDAVAAGDLPAPAVVVRARSATARSSTASARGCGPQRRAAGSSASRPRVPRR